MSHRILLVEDDESLAKLIGDNLAFEGYQVHHAGDGNQALNVIQSFAPDLILLDLMLPGVDGFTICRTIGSSSPRIPVIVISVRDQDSDKIRALRLGADDYVTKPFSILELLARIEAVMRRTRSSPDRAVIGNLVIDFRARSAIRGRTKLSLTEREFEILRLLWEHRDAIVSRERLLRTVWGYSEVPATRTVDFFIARLRAKIEKDPRRPQYLHTIYGKGYRLRGGDA